MPANREAVPMWGRTKAVRDAHAANRALGIPAVMKIDNRKVLADESYAWVWALAKWLDTHPRYRDRFRKLKDHVLRDDFNELFRAAYADDWNDLELEWQQFVATLDYGCDTERAAFEFAAERPLPSSGTDVKVAADRGWQSTGYRLEAGRTDELTADGQFVIGREPDGTPWPCEANGITLEYYAGRPLGILLAAVDPGGDSTERAKAFTEPIEIGTRTKLTAPRSGVLWLRVNDSPSRLAENEGAVRVRVKPQ
jgi:hypothetical protein